MKVYVLIAYRWNVQTAHNYIAGVWTDKNRAIKEAEVHTSYRAGKYSVWVAEIEMDATGKPFEDSYDSPEYAIIYKTRIVTNYGEPYTDDTPCFH